MYAGHYAIALAIKAGRPALPSWPLLFGAVFLDILAGAMTLLRLEDWAWPLGAGTYLLLSTALTDRHHALVAAMVWAGLWGAVFVRDHKLAKLAALAVFSHFLVDWPLHYPELVSHPHREHHLGLGAGYGFGWHQWLWEAAVIVLTVAYAACRGSLRNSALLAAFGLVWLLFLLMFPSWPWMRIAEQLRAQASPLQEGLAMVAAYAGLAGLLSWMLDRRAALQRVAG